MVSITSKPTTSRTAIATGRVSFSNPLPLSLINSNSLKKGDVLAVARIAGIMAAKKCPDLVPLCHPIAISSVTVDLFVIVPPQTAPDPDGHLPKTAQLQPSHDVKHGKVDYGAITVEARVTCLGATGVEMEALTAVMGAAATVYDMCKAVDKGMVVGDVRVVLKEGGRSGTWKEEGWKSLAE